MKTKMLYNINLLGLILVLIGVVLYGLINKVTRLNPLTYNLLLDLKTIRELSLPPSAILIFGGTFCVL